MNDIDTHTSTQLMQGLHITATGNAVGLLLCGRVQSMAPHTSGAGTVCSRTLSFSSLCPYACCKPCSPAGSVFQLKSSRAGLENVAHVDATED